MELPKILLVDDTKLLLEMEKSFLANSPVRILTAENGKEALEIISRERPDLVLLDHNMPVMNGITCCLEIRKDPALGTMPVLMVSSAVTKEDCQKFVQAGSNGFLAKPLERQNFLTTIRAYLPSIERRGPRAACGSAVTVGIEGKSFPGRCENISVNGMYVAFIREPAIGSEVFLSFSLPGAGDDSLITARGRVKWCNGPRQKCAPDLPAGFGVEFIEIVGTGLPIVRKTEIQKYVDSFRQKA